MSNYPAGVSDNDFDLPSVGEDDGPLSPEEQDEDALAKLAEDIPRRRTSLRGSVPALRA